MIQISAKNITKIDVVFLNKRCDALNFEFFI